MGTREIFKDNLKFYRKQKGFSQEKLSELIGYGITYITELETREKFPKPETIDLISEKLGILPYQLFMPRDMKSQRNEIILAFSNELNDAFKSVQERFLV